MPQGMAMQAMRRVHTPQGMTQCTRCMRCMRRVVWGVGVKPFYTSFRTDELRRTVGSFRALLLGGWQLPPQGAPSTTLFLERGRKPGGRFLSDLRTLRAAVHIDQTCCDFTGPLIEQVRALSTFSHVLTCSHMISHDLT